LESQNQFINALKNTETQASAFAKLIADYKERLYWHIRKIVIDHDDANDVLQNTFVKVFQNINGFKENSTIYTWMYKIATNEALNLIKKKSKHHGVSNADWIETKASKLESDCYFDGDELSVRLQNAVSKLPEKQRLVFNMKYFDEMKYDNISEILGTSVGGLKASYHIAVKKIKKQINE
jgi:RNA polymerase sigma factor (sigma-70 family)